MLQCGLRKRRGALGVVLGTSQYIVIRTLKCDQTAGINPIGHARQVHADKSGLTAYHVEILMPCCCSELRVDRSK